jgi:hypothetical protein
MPDGLFGFTAMTMRYQWRVTTFQFFMRESYPPFEFSSVGPDPGVTRRLCRCSPQRSSAGS